jgi:hypothetical protein
MMLCGWRLLSFACVRAIVVGPSIWNLICFVGFARVRLKNVSASACFHSSSCSSDGLKVRIGIFSPLFIGFGALMYEILF